jgi:hypothetical protein
MPTPLDPAAVFAAALSLWESSRHRVKCARMNLSDAYSGWDQFMREIMRIAELFEDWACRHVAFEQWGEVWPYYLGDRFGEACLECVTVDSLAAFDEADCLRVAMQMRLPIKLDSGLLVPLDVAVENPIPDSAFCAFRVRSVRVIVEEDEVVGFGTDDDPDDARFSPPFFGLYGVSRDGLMEHIADRRCYLEAVALVEKLVTGVIFPRVLQLRN